MLENNLSIIELPRMEFNDLTWSESKWNDTE